MRIKMFNNIFYKIKMAIYALIVTNMYGMKLKKTTSNKEKKSLRVEYSDKILSKLNINIIVNNQDKLPKDGQFLLVVNHRSILDPMIVELTLQNTSIFGLWVAKKEMVESFFLGTFIKNAGTVSVNRESRSVRDLFKEITPHVENKDSIFVFPEGTRNKENSRLAEFKQGTQLIALKNKLPILPIYIKTDANIVLEEALKNNTKSIDIIVEVGDILEYNIKSRLEESYRNMFNLSPN